MYIWGIWELIRSPQLVKEASEISWLRELFKMRSGDVSYSEVDWKKNSDIARRDLKKATMRVWPVLVSLEGSP